MRQRRALVITPEWATAIQGFDHELRFAGRPKSTRRLRRYQLRSFAHDHRNTGPWKIRRTDIVAWMLDQDWVAATRSSYRAALRLFYQWGHQEGHLDEDPTIKLPHIRVPAGLPRPAPDDAVDEALRTSDEAVKLAIWIMTLTGARRAEVATLNRDSVIHDLRGWSLRVVGKGGKVRDIPIDAGMAQAILSCTARGFWLFRGGVDGHISAGWLGKRISRALPGRWTAHTLRHRFGTLTYNETQDIRVVQELLGHASVTTTQVYTLVADHAKRRAVVGARRGLRISGAQMAHRGQAALPCIADGARTDLPCAAAALGCAPAGVRAASRCRRPGAATPASLERPDTSAATNTEE